MGVPFMVRRGFQFYFRMRVPTDLTEYFDRVELKRSLGTSDHKEARRRVHLVAAKAHQTFDEMRKPELSYEELRKLAEDYLHSQLEWCEWVRTEGGLIPRNVTELEANKLSYSNLIDRVVEALTALDTLETQKKGLKLAENLVDPEVLLCDMVDIPKDSNEYVFFTRELLKRLLELYRVELERLSGNYSNPYDRERLYGKTSQVQQQFEPEKPKGLLLSEVMETYRSEHVTFGKWTSKTKEENVSIIHVLIELVGDRPITDVTHQDLLDFRTSLAKLPPNPKKGHKKAGKNLREILEMNLTPMSQSNVRKYLTRLASFFKWAELHKYVPTNEARGITINKPKKLRASEERKAYDLQELQQIVKGIPCTPRAPEQFWVPMISMFSGLRLDEGCQLHIEDVRDINGIPCFDVNEEGTKKVKTPSSVRIVPVHPVLIDLGFLKYVERIRAEGKPRLWMNCVKKRDGYAMDYGKVFQRFNRKFISKDRKKVFHSLRHNLANTLKQRLVSETVIAELIGHEHDNITSGRYGKIYEPQVLLDALLKLDYGLDLTTFNGTPPL